MAVSKTLLGVGILLTAKDRMSRIIQRAAVNVDGLGNSADGVIEKFGKLGLLKTAGAAALISGTILAGGLIFAGKKAGDFEETMIGVTKITGFAGTELDRLTDGMLKLGQTIPTPLEGLGAIAEIGAQMNLRTADEIVSFTRQVAKASLAMGVTAEGVADLAGVSLTFFGDLVKGVDDINKVLDPINSLADSSRTSAKAIIDNAIALGKQKDILKLTTPEIIGLATAFGEMKVRPQRAANSLARILSRMRNDVSGFAKIAGTDINTFAKILDEDPIRAVQAIGFAIKDLTGIQQAQLLKGVGLAGFPEINKLLVLMGTNWERTNEKIARANKEIAAGTSIQIEFANRMKNLNPQITLLKNTFEVLIISFGNALLPILKLVVLGFQNLVDMIVGIPKPIKIGIVIMTAIASVILLVTGAALLLTVAIAGLIVGVPILTAAILALDVAILPIFLISLALVIVFGALAAIIAVVLINWKKITAFLKRVTAPAVKILRKEWARFRKEFAPQIAMLKKFAVFIGGKFKIAVKGMISIGKDLIETYGVFLTKGFTLAAKAVGKIVDALIFVRDMAKTITVAITSTITLMISSIKSGIVRVLNFVDGKINSINSRIKKINSASGVVGLPSIPLIPNIGGGGKGKSSGGGFAAAGAAGALGIQTAFKTVPTEGAGRRFQGGIQTSRGKKTTVKAPVILKLDGKEISNSVMEIQEQDKEQRLGGGRRGNRGVR